MNLVDDPTHSYCALLRMASQTKKIGWHIVLVDFRNDSSTNQVFIFLPIHESKLEPQCSNVD